MSSTSESFLEKKKINKSFGRVDFIRALSSRVVRSLCSPLSVLVVRSLGFCGRVRRRLAADGRVLGAPQQLLPAVLGLPAGLRLLRRRADRQREEEVDGTGPIRPLRYFNTVPADLELGVGGG